MPPTAQAIRDPYPMYESMTEHPPFAPDPHSPLTYDTPIYPASDHREDILKGALHRIRNKVPVQDDRSLEELISEVSDFCEDTYEGAGLEAQMLKIIEEIEEFVENPSDAEAADILIVLINISRIMGFSLKDALSEKFAIIKEREWAQQPSGAYHHVSDPLDPMPQKIDVPEAYVNNEIMHRVNLRES